MTLVEPLAVSHKFKLPENYNRMTFMEKLYTKRSDMPAITHVDFSARIQTVHHETNPDFHTLLKYFKALTGCGVLINTSFNVRGEPIVQSAEDAIRCFMNTEMDYLVINNYLFAKTEQTESIYTMPVNINFVLD